MQVRQPIAAGRFYSSSPRELRAEVGHYLQADASRSREAAPWGMMLPHAGYVYCGSVIGATLANAKMAKKLIILCPNHTGRGKMLGVWPDGQWLTPLGTMKVEQNLAQQIIDCGGGFESDINSHLGEHSIEVLLPFLQVADPDAEIVPICVGVKNAQVLAQAGRALAAVLKKPDNSGVGIIVSSDMNHYENERQTLIKDAMALEKAAGADPAGLLQVTDQHNISMCGAAPLALALYTAKNLGRADVEIVAHDTSGRASGDYSHVVGYAGLRVFVA